MARTLFDPPDAKPDPAVERPTRTSSSARPGTPLAERLRPRDLDEMVGQQAVVGESGFLRRAIAEDRVPSMILWGPPGVGKTTLAEIVARRTTCRYVPFSAVTAGIKEVKEVMAGARRFRQADGRRTLVFIDEIHRFNRAQQDAFLPYVESGDIVLVGATTENPSFQINGALLSRCRVVVLEPLSEDDVRQLVQRALADPRARLPEEAPLLADEALESLARFAGGDARRALNLLEVVLDDAASSGRSNIDRSTVERVAQRKILLYDKSGEEHFNLISALHKSLRDSDVDASVYWLVRMLESGEEAAYIARRMVRFASEDIGLADPNALRRALDGWQAFERLGSPEGDLALVQVAIYLAAAPKSAAAYRAHKAARRTLAERPADPVPMAIRNAPTGLMRDLGYGAGYASGHDEPEGTAGLDCLPDALAGTRFYEPTTAGFEARLGERLDDLARRRSEAKRRRGGS
ncbi:MAG: replication-associated recombination protein A [Acidobacteriota bacterium]